MSRTGAAVVGLIDYQAGNIRSLSNAIEYLGATVRRVTAAADMEGVSHVLLPGVGAFGHCAAQLRASGLVPVLEEWALVQQRPLLGICVGMQLLADTSDELGQQQGLGWAGGYVRHLEPEGPDVRVPHVGWNNVRFEEPFGDFRAGEEADFYFDHSYAFREPSRARTTATCCHGTVFSAVIRCGSVVAAQFHPEKSQASGLRFLGAFLDSVA